jgi:hypothetical protein
MADDVEDDEVDEEPRSAHRTEFGDLANDPSQP